MSDFETHTENICNYLKTYLCKDRPEFSRYWDARDENPIDIVTWSNYHKLGGLSCMMTINLSYYPLLHDGKLITDYKTEIMAVCPKRDEKIFGSIIATCAHCVINYQYYCCPYNIFPNVIKSQNISSEMKHVFFTPPFLFPEKLSSVIIDNIEIMWLMVTPISNEEYQYAIDHSVEELGGLFEDNKIEYWNLNRMSAHYRPELPSPNKSHYGEFHDDMNH